ncbi:amidohydrolase family protein [Ancylobacter amanitiformis]|uniref:2,3-dihydroxybenzoate decarboxylase n=1 Tax=Ancylobacter amanitiformis TaxID=217069 RepID=A0ABU0LTC2_9HYPH|nr:amidohydrolase family protein [Ancylobacter amanitiformis]MDQ0511945.1 2,3-dihydroxybenzoate decarboxylase [Ancylobacter amanitiformis]
MKIALEEHVIFPPFLDYLARAMPRVTPQVHRALISRLSDFGERRLMAMDGAGVERAVLSLSGPGVQVERDTARATRGARMANDLLATEVARRPARYAGFAHLAMQDPAAAADELERCVRELGFVGAMINGHTLGIYLDDPRFDIFWERLQHLDVPLYLHPDDSWVKPHVLEGCDELLKPTWEWTFETASHALRLVFSGVFDRYPRVRVILGHMGETLPYVLWRLDSRAALTSGNRPLKAPPSHYLRRNFFVTTSGQCSDVPLLAALAALGDEHVLFAIDYPYEDSDIAARFIEAAAISEATRGRLCRGNALNLLRLAPHAGSAAGTSAG